MRKKTIYSLLVVLVLIGLCWGGYKMLNRGAPVTAAIANVDAAAPEAGTAYAALKDSTGGLPGMSLAAQDDELSLYFNPDNAQIAIKQLKSGQVWYSNPTGANDDSKAQPFEKGTMNSQFMLTFRDKVMNEVTFGSYSDSVEKKQFTVESIKNGVRVIYTVGDSSKGVAALPKLISKTRLQEKVLDKVDEASAGYVSNRYYPSKSNPDVLELLEEQVKKELVLKKMVEAFAKAGYTEEDLAADNAENGADGGSASTTKAKFVVTLEYRLNGGRLSVRIPVGSIEETKGFTLRTIELMNFFGAAGTSEQGYILVPDGSGSLIYFNNGKINDDHYSQVVYGQDHTDNSTRRSQVSESARMPVFGMKSGDAAWYGVIDKGEALASINADISGKTNSYNHAYASFQVRGEDSLFMYSGGKESEIPIMTKSLYAGDIEVSYGFLNGANANYAGIAAEYRNTLADGAGLQPLTAGENKLPFYVDVVGATTVTKSILGIPYEALNAVTTFKQAGIMADEMNAQGIDNIRMRMLGWSSGGVYHEPSAAKPLGKLGGTSAFKKLADKLKNSGGALYPDTALLHVYEDTLGFAPSSDAARFTTREVALQAPINRALNRMDEDLGLFYLLSPSKLPTFIDRFSSHYSRLGLSSLSLRDLGEELNGDYRASRVVNRQTAKSIAEDGFSSLHSEYADLMVDGGNSYSLPYASHIIDAPMSSSGFNITDESVPFYELVLHGFADYTGEPINQSTEQDPSKQLLKLLEYGASPRFVWTYESSTAFKFTKFDYWYATQYTDWLNQAAGLYKKADEVLAPLRSVPMTNHEKLQEGVYRSTFGNGTTITVNYNDSAVTVDGVSIDSNQYVIGGEGA